MTKREFKISLIITLIYWIPSSIALLDIIKEYDMQIPSWLYYILLPGHFLGLFLGFFVGNSWAFIGQLISLTVLFFISLILWRAYNK